MAKVDTFKESDYKHEQDAYAFGILFYEIYFMVFAFKGTYSKQLHLLEDIIVNTARPVIGSKSQGTKAVKLMQSCWNQDTAQRPNFKDITITLNEIEAEQQQQNSAVSR